MREPGHIKRAPRVDTNFSASLTDSDGGRIPVVVTDACGAGNEAAGQRAVDAIRFTGDAFLTDTDTICGIWHTSVTT